jgi:cation transport protein ChaC
MPYVFAYGSLMWNPGFPVERSEVGLLRGWRRSWCVKSTFYRGSAENPGYVLGLKRDGMCLGTVHAVEVSTAEDIVRALDLREMRETGYTRQVLLVDLNGKTVNAIVYTSEDLDEPSPEALHRAVVSAAGHGGSNLDYIERTLE